MASTQRAEPMSPRNPQLRHRRVTLTPFLRATRNQAQLTAPLRATHTLHLRVTRMPRLRGIRRAPLRGIRRAFLQGIRRAPLRGIHQAFLQDMVPLREPMVLLLAIPTAPLRATHRRQPPLPGSMAVQRLRDIPTRCLPVRRPRLECLLPPPQGFTRAVEVLTHPRPPRLPLRLHQNSRHPRLPLRRLPLRA
ncbi:MAG: hypothetical protein C0467_22795 [Planctomycetaceae bacterium]|nr:hypothetical protein [Planctomycetaceae bacterium]